MIGEEKGSVAISGRSSHKMTGLVIHFTRGRRESVWRKSSYLIKNFKKKIKKSRYD